MEGEAGIRNSLRMKNADIPFATSIDEEFSYQRNSGSTILQLFQENMPSIGRWPQLAVSKGSDASALSTGCRRIIFKETLYLGLFVHETRILQHNCCMSFVHLCDTCDFCLNHSDLAKHSGIF